MSEVSTGKMPIYQIFLLLVGAKILDLITTYIGLKNGYGVESSPIASYFLNTYGFLVMSTISILVVLGDCLFFIYSQKFIEKKNVSSIFLKIINLSIYICFGINMLAVINNSVIILQNII
jgi:hypothetical protein